MLFNDRKNAVVPMRRFEPIVIFHSFTRFACVRLRIVGEKVEKTAICYVKHAVESADAVFWQDLLDKMEMKLVDSLKVANRRFSANSETMRLVVCFQDVNFSIIQLPTGRFVGRNDDHFMCVIGNVGSED